MLFVSCQKKQQERMWPFHKEAYSFRQILLSASVLDEFLQRMMPRVPRSITVGSDSTWFSLFLRGPQRKPSITSSWSITSDSQFVTTSLSLAVSFREATRNHILMSFHDRIRRTIKTFPFKQSHIIIIPLGKKEQRGQTKRLIFLFRFRNMNPVLIAKGQWW